MKNVKRLAGIELLHRAAFISVASRASSPTVCLCDCVCIYISSGSFHIYSANVCIMRDSICYSGSMQPLWLREATLPEAEIGPNIFWRNRPFSPYPSLLPTISRGMWVSSCFLAIWGQRCMLADLIGTFSLHCKICWRLNSAQHLCALC